MRYDLFNLKLFTGLELFAQHSPYVGKLTNRKLFQSGFNPTLFSANTTVMSATKIRPWQYGAQIRPGILLSPSTLLFGTIGASVAKLSCHYDATFSNSVTGDSLNLDLDSRKTRCVLRAGGGLEYVLRFKWHIRADYIYTNYRAIPLNGSRSFNFGPPIGTASIVSDSKIHFKDHAITIGLNRYL